MLKCNIDVIKCHSFFFRNIHILKQQLSGLWEQENHLTLVPGYTGNIAKVIQFQLHLVMNIAVSLAVFLSFDPLQIETPLFSTNAQVYCSSMYLQMSGLYFLC